MKKTKIKSKSLKVFSIILSLIMILSAFPLTAFAAYSPEYYYPAGTKFIKELAICYYKNQQEARNAIMRCCDYLLDVDTTKGTGGDYYVYIGWNWTTNPNEAVRGIRLDHNGGVPHHYDQGGATWYPINSGNHAWVPQLHGDGVVDLNRGAGGDDIKLYATKSIAAGPPLTYLDIANGYGTRDTKVSQGWKTVVTFQDNSWNLDINKGAGGDDLLMVTYSYCTPVRTADLRNAIPAGSKYVTSGNYTKYSRDELGKAVTNGNNIISAFDSSTNEGCTTYTQSAINNAKDNIYAKMNVLQTTLTLNGSVNGGTDRVIYPTIGTNNTYTFNTSSYSSSKTGWTFLGWSKNSTDVDPLSGNISLGFNETLYALFKKNVNAEFNYLDENGKPAVTERYTEIYNNSTSGLVPSVPVNNVTVNGRTFTHIGWRTDTKAETPQYPVNHRFNIKAADPSIKLYAVYSAPITLTYDLNGGSSDMNKVDEKTQYMSISSVSGHEFTIKNDIPVINQGNFLGWADSNNTADPAYTGGNKITVKDNKTVYAIYEMITYTVRIYDENNNLIDTQTVNHGDNAVAPSYTPAKAPDDVNHYIFKGWNGIENIRKNTDVYPEFTAVPHTFETTVIKEATCLEKGLENRKCACGYNKDVETDALGHDLIINPGYPATCTRAGETDYIQCRRCYEVIQKNERIEPTGHDYELTETIDATCIKGGYEVWTCKNNPAHTEIRNKTAPTGIHKIKEIKGYPATCTENGLSDGAICEVCGAVVIPQVIILAGGHNLIKDKAVIATCTHTGLTEGCHCTNCDYKVPQEVVPMLEHKWVEFTGSEATCEKAGFTTGLICEGCGKIINSVDIPALGHNYIGVHHDATCTTPEYIVYTCANDPSHTYTEEISPALGHTGGKATCQGPAICTRCGEAYGEKGSHEYVEKVIPPTCTEKGYSEFTCVYCNDTYKDKETAVIPHEYVKTVTLKPTCTQPGIVTYSCKNCNDTYTEEISALGHKIDKWELVENEAHGTCTICGETFIENPENVGLEIPTCERCGMKHIYKTGIFKYKGIYCNLVYFFRQIVDFFNRLGK